MRVACFNHKGGCGKTTLAVHIAFLAMELKKPCLVVDLDRQGNAFQWLTGYETEPDEQAFTGLGANVDVLYSPGNVPKEIAKDDDRMIVFDCPPAYSVGKVLLKQMKPDIFLIPVNGRMSIIGAMNVTDEMKSIKELKAKGKIIIIPNMVNIRSTVGTEELEAASQTGADWVWDLPICAAETVRRAEAFGKAAWDIPYGRRAKATMHLRALCEWILKGAKIRTRLPGKNEKPEKARKKIRKASVESQHHVLTQKIAKIYAE